MKFFARLRSTVVSLFRRSELASQIEEELRFHLEARADDLVRQGLSPAEAARQARMELGSANTHHDEVRRSLGVRWFDDLLADLRYAARILRKNPSFTAIAAGSLALAIGANTTIFSVANAALYERLGVPHPEQLRLLHLTGDKNVVVHASWGEWDKDDGGRSEFDSFSYPVYQQLRRDNTVLSEIFAFKNLGQANATIDGQARVVQVELVSGNLYEQIGIRPVVGRPIVSSDDGAPGTGAVAVISNALWRHSFGSDPNVVGKVITVNTLPITVIGVNPPSFTGAKSVQVSPDIFMPISMIPVLRAESARLGPILSSRLLFWINVMARTKPGISDEKARAALQVSLDAAIRSTMSPEADETLPTLEVTDGSRGLNFSGKHLAKPLNVLLVFVGLVLVLACANVANLMLARTLARQREMSVRLALGAGRSRILRQVITEGMLLSAAGGTLGLVAAYFGHSTLPRFLFNVWESQDLHIPFDWKIFAFTAVLTLLSGILFAALPAWAATRAEINSSLKEGAGTATRHRKALSGRAIVAFQVALSTLLLAGAGLFIRTLIHLNNIDPGFRADHLLLFEISPPSKSYPAPQDIALHHRLEDAIRVVPGVEDVALSDVVLIANSRSNANFNVEGRSRHNGSDENSDLANVGPDFFQVMRIPIVSGRAFTQQDAESPRATAVITQSAAKKFFPGENPIGKRFSTDDDPGRMIWYEIVGVCADVHYNSLRRKPEALHFDLYRQQHEIGGASYIVRTAMPPEAIVPSLRAAVQRIDKDLPLIDIRTQQEQIDATTQQERIFASLTVGFGVLALALACVGIYGIMTYTVAQRTSEIGIRLALGAQRARVRAMVLRESIWLTVIGIAAGLVSAVALGRLVKSMLFGLGPNDPISLTGAGLLLLAIAVTAAWIPAARASRIEPMEALRHD
ncbi:ABC transporter permease [Terriglobus albidus]|uniref:ABC transporter permease n=1 Tax=Terriglobus albidus TaxID=1592106 RepID=A0A5B9EFN4_9BACT|nr:ABC transporter permease [Terriglobus albidus]QEE30464.1 ABC transporter permease [Terriglobus albidus]